jgi:hypothetical protein
MQDQAVYRQGQAAVNSGLQDTITGLQTTVTGVVATTTRLEMMMQNYDAKMDLLMQTLMALSSGSSAVSPSVFVPTPNVAGVVGSQVVVAGDLLPPSGVPPGPRTRPCPSTPVRSTSKGEDSGSATPRMSKAPRTSGSPSSSTALEAPLAPCVVEVSGPEILSASMEEEEESWEEPGAVVESEEVSLGGPN